MKKILLVFGTRPEAIKMAPLVNYLLKHNDKFLTKVCVTAQHREMLDQVLDIFEINPDYDLDMMKTNQDLYDITANGLLKLRDVYRDFSPNLVLVHGDTATSTTAALGAYYKQIPVGHIEAGLRTGDIYSPFPEEMNRKITGAVSTLHFSPTKKAKQNLIFEGVREERIIVTGNTVIDALHIALNKIEKNDELKLEIEKILKEEISNYQEVINSKFILVTGHRRENFGHGFVNICTALKTIAQKYPNINIIYPVHLNPNVQRPVFELLSQDKNIHLISPLSYLPFISLLEKSYLVVTDSGGIQEEAPSLGKPVIVMRDTTERPEAVEAGTVKLVGTDKDLIVKEVSDLLENDTYYKSMSLAHNPYGDGKACERIIDFLLSADF